MSGVGGDSAVCGQIEHLRSVIFTACDDFVSIGTPGQIIDPVGVIGKRNGYRLRPLETNYYR